MLVLDSTRDQRNGPHESSLIFWDQPSKILNNNQGNIICAIFIEISQFQNCLGVKILTIL